MRDFYKDIETVEASLSVKLNEMKKYNVSIGDRRTSVTLEPIIWDVLNALAAEQGCTVNELCTFIDSRNKKGGNLSSAIRVFLIAYLFIKHKEYGSHV